MNEQKQILKEELNIKDSLKKVWGSDKSMVEHCLKSSYYLKLKDCFVSFDHKPTIQKTLYYNDEYKSPEITKENFISYNMRYNFKNALNYNLDNDLFLFPNYDQAPEIKYLRDLKPYEMERENINNLRKVTKEEKIIIKNLLDSFKENYLKRLNTYWKRYKDKVSSHGYWANR